jgi:anti-sigma B factor antagonist
VALKIRVKQTKPGLVTLFPTGSIDSDGAVIAEKEINRLLAEPIVTLVLDMEGVDFISSVGVGLMAKTKGLLNRKSADLAMINLQPQISKVFEIMRLLPTLNVFESVRELDEYLNKVQQRILDEGE